MESGLRSKLTGKPLGLSSVHRILTNKMYRGDFDWDGVTYNGKHKPLVSRQLWLDVQDTLKGRNRAKHRRMRHDLAFSRLIECGHCGCSLVGERKKDRSTYYHCTGYRGRCEEPYAREEALESQISPYLEAIGIGDEVVEWVSKALKENSERRSNALSTRIGGLQSEYDEHRARLEEMYEDKLRGRISGDLYDQKAAECRAHMDRLYEAVTRLEADAESDDYVDRGFDLLELARTAHTALKELKGSRKRQLVKSVLSNCVWMDGRLSADYQQPFGIVADTNAIYREGKAAGDDSGDLLTVWYP